MIVVFGSINLDLVVALPRLPRPGETVVGPDCQTFPGGKGANQALAAARAGAQVAMIGAVGDDSFAEPALAGLRDAGVDLSGVRRLPGATGVAMIGVDAAAENLIMCASGVNARVAADWLDGRLNASDLLVLQRELALDPIAEAVERARAIGARILLNAAPSGGGGVSALIDQVDIVVANEAEAQEVAAEHGTIAKTSEDCLSALAGPDRLAIVTLGGAGLVARRGNIVWRVPAAQVSVVDTTGAGDAFVGALAAALDRGAGIGRALAEGSAAGGLATTATGAQSSAPTASAIAELADQLEPAVVGPPPPGR